MKFSELKKDRFVRNIFLRLSVLIILASVFSLVLFFLSNSISAKSSETEDIRRRITEMNIAGETFSSLLRDYQIVSPYLSEIEDILPTKDKLINFSEQISEMADSLNISHTFLFRSEGEENGLKYIDFSLVLRETDIDSLSSFLELLKKSKYFVDLISFDITGSRVQGSDNISISIFGRIFIKNT